MSAPLAQRPGLALTLTREQYAELRAEMEQDLGRALSRCGLDFVTHAAKTWGEPIFSSPETQKRVKDAIRGLEPGMQSRARQLLDALARLHAGTYGICVACRSPIAYGRLLALPETRVCVHCSWYRESCSEV